MSLRKQEIADRLNAWIIFNEKNKELCEWLMQMENKVAHNSDLNIEEMVEKLKKVGGCSESTMSDTKPVIIIGWSNVTGLDGGKFITHSADCHFTDWSK